MQRGVLDGGVAGGTPAETKQETLVGEASCPRWRRQRWGGGGVRAEGPEARRPSCRRQDFRTVKGLRRLHLPVRGSRKRREEGNTRDRTERKRTDENSFKEQSKKAQHRRSGSPSPNKSPQRKEANSCVNRLLLLITQAEASPDIFLFVYPKALKSGVKKTKKEAAETSRGKSI